MKILKPYSILFFLCLLMIGCSDDDEIETIFENNVSTRIEQQLAEYRTALLSSEFGWKVRYQPGEDQSVFNVHLNFNGNGNVVVSSDYQENEKDFGSTYRVGISQVPELVLENYTMFHSLFEADGFSTGAEFEFLFEEVNEDEIIFKSKTDIGDRSPIVFEKAEQEDSQVIKSRSVQDKRIAFDTIRTFKTIKAESTVDDPFFEADFAFNLDNRIAISKYITQSNQLVEERHPMEITDTGFSLLTPFEIGGALVSDFDYDMATNTHVSNDGGFTTVIEVTPESAISVADRFDQIHSLYSFFDGTIFSVISPLSRTFFDLAQEANYQRLNVVFNGNKGNLSDVNFFEFIFDQDEENERSVAVFYDFETIDNEKVVFVTNTIDPIASVNATQEDVDNLIDVLNVLFDSDGWSVERTDTFDSQNIPIYTLRPMSALESGAFFSVYGLN